MRRASTPASGGKWPRSIPLRSVCGWSESTPGGGVCRFRLLGASYLYATPEIQFDRDEFAPRSPLRDGLEHIAEAAERDRTQVSAHDEPCATSSGSFRMTIRFAVFTSSSRRPAPSGTTKNATCGRRRRSTATASTWSSTARPHTRCILQTKNTRLSGSRRQRPSASNFLRSATRPRAKAAVAEHLLSERERAAATAARLSPPDYIKRELGERPSDPTKARAWDKAVQGDRGLQGQKWRKGQR